MIGVKDIVNTKIIISPFDSNNWNTLQHYMFRDLVGAKNVYWLEGRLKHIKSMTIRFLRKVHLSMRLNSAVPLPLRSIWKTCLDDIVWDNDSKYYIIFLDTPRPIALSKLEQLKRRYNICYVMILLNSWMGDIAKLNKKYVDSKDIDYVFTYDYGDSVSHEFIFTDMLYSRLPIETTYCGPDIYYIGGNNGRITTIHEIYDAIKKHDLIATFRVTGVPEKDMRYTNDIKYNQFIDYKKALEEMSSCNCILELLRDPQKQVCATLRYYEAVCYNKKLLTNNKNVVNLPFYNPNYVHIFEKAEDIDWEWIKERITVDYHYDGRFSPIHLIDKIIQLEDNKNKLSGD